MSLLKTFILMMLVTCLFIFVGASIGGKSGMLISLVIAIAMNGFAYWNSDTLALKIYKAHPADSKLYGELIHHVEQLAEQAKLPTPKTYVIDNPQPNAFATGRNKDNASVAVTTGLIDLLSDRELKGVIAHELAHIKNRDTLIMTVTATMAGAISMLANFAFFFGRNSRNGHSNIVVTIVVMVLAPLAAMLIQMAISRTREYDADKVGADICKDPRALASALQKIDAHAQQINNIEAEANPSTAHMFIINPLHSKRIDNLFSTHPNTKNRVAKLLERTGDRTPPPLDIKKKNHNGPWG